VQRYPPRRGGEGIHPLAVFHALLHHERSRSDREGSEFSLVVLDVTGLGSNGQGIKLVARTAQEQMRSIDEVGWIDSNSIGVLLPATKTEGGRGFARRLCESMPTPPSPIPWKVYTYPAHWLPTDDSQTSDGARKSPRSAEDRVNESRAKKTIKDVFAQRVPVWKRGMDLLGSVILLAVLSPLFLVTTIYIKIVSPGKVFFKQRRVGYRGKLFTFMKFRTMRENSNTEAHRQYLKELINSTKPMEKLDHGSDPRIIPGGKIIRKACLDELPQLFNVLRGDMSLVGPRPCILYEAEEYLRWHTHRFDILPGMTGLWQVSGKNKLSFEQMVRLDIAYANRMSFLFDLKILFLTAPAIVGMVFEAGLKRLNMKVLTPTTISLSKGDEKGCLGDA
jgi:lipopolysaccharide/colanic/teichoic acid biosynthesis glycosyltransferase